MKYTEAEILKVHLIKTPEFNSELYLDVCYFLQSFLGPMEFIEDTKLTSENEENENTNQEEQDTLINDEFNHYLKTYKGSFDSDEFLLTLCSLYKSDHNHSNDSLVVLLTNHRTTENLPSIYNSHNNIVIAVADWDRFPEVHDLNPITHLIIKTVLESITNSAKAKSDVVKSDSTHRIDRIGKKIKSHEVPRDCVNDKAENHFRVLLKLNNSKYCEFCTKAMVRDEAMHKVVLQGIKILEAVVKLNQSNIKKKDFLERYKSYDLQSKIILFKDEESEKIYFEDFDAEVHLPAIQKALYIFFLINCYESGITMAGLPENSPYILLLYKLFADRDVTDEAMANQVKKLTENYKRNCGSYISEIKRRLIRDLGAERADAFCISGSPTENMSVRIPKEKIHIRDRGVLAISTCKGLTDISSNNSEKKDKPKRLWR